MADIVGGSIIWKLDIESANFDKKLSKASADSKKLSSDIGSASTSATKSLSGLGNAFSSISDSIQGVVVAAAKMATVGSLGLGVFVKSAADLQQTSQAMKVLTGNTEVANKLFGQLATYANNTPFEFPQIAKAGRTLLGFGISSSEVYDRIRILGDLAAATGADFNHLAVVYGQVNAAGRLMGQDSLQLINNNIPITNILTKKLGITAAELRDQIEKGAVSADIFNQALKETTEAGGFAFNGVDVLAQTFNGRMSTLKDTVLEFGRNLLGVKVDPELGLVVAPGGIFDRLSHGINDIIDGLKELGPRVAGGFQWIVQNGDTVKAVLAGVAAAFVTAKVAAIGFAIAAAINPVSIIAGAILLLIGGLVALQVKFDFIGKAMERWGGQIKAIQDVLGKVWKFISDFATTIGKQLVPVFNSIVETGKAFWGVLEALWPVLKIIGIIIGVTLVAGIWLFMNALKLVLPVVNFVVATIGVAFDIVAAIIRGTITVVTTVWNIIFAIISGVVNAIVWVFTSAWEIIKGVWNAVVGFFQGIWNGITAVFEVVANWFKDKFQQAWDGIKRIFGAVGGFFQSVWDTIKEKFTSIGSAIGDTIGSAFKTVVNSIIGFAEDKINFFIRAINGAIGAINKIPGVNISKLTELSIPRLAKGGIVPATPGGVLANIAEGGEAEAVIPLSKLERLMSPDVGSRMKSSSTTENDKVQVNQTYNVYNEIDMRKGLSDLAWRLNNA